MNEKIKLKRSLFYFIIILKLLLRTIKLLIIKVLFYKK